MYCFCNCKKIIVRYFQPECLSIAIICTILLPSSYGLSDVLNSHPLLKDGHAEKDAQDPFDPAFMDPRNFNTEKESPPGGICQVENIQCNSSSPYRTYDGTCNNLAHPTWGKDEECHTRILEANYEGEFDLRRSVHGGPLPPPRSLSLKAHGNRHRPSPTVSFFFTMFGQLVAHDITMLMMQKVRSGINDPGCCDAPISKNTSLCAPYYVKPNDPYYNAFNTTCPLPLPRSLPCTSCKSGKRQTVNHMTASLDASMTYGTSEKKALDLRTLDGSGRMRVEKTEQGDLLPRVHKSDPVMLFCLLPDKDRCFDSGDGRVNQHCPLTSLHTLFVREHNNIADQLGELNPHWNDETRYQEARRIVIAEMQNIVYSEYLNVVLGPAHMSHYNLSVNADNIETRYDPNVRLGIWNEFSTSIFRLHSMIPSQVGFDHHRFKDYFGNVKLIREGNMDKILQGGWSVPAQQNDNWFVKDVTNDLYHIRLNKYLEYGDDLVSLDLQRGRDNGIATYVDMLRHLTRGRMNVSTFDELQPLMPKSNIRLLKKTYRDVRDVDLFAGALAESHVPGSNLGPTASAIVSMQFNIIKFGDRFFFEHEGEAGSFTPDQRKELKKTTISDVLCRNLNIQSIQKNPFLLENEKNPVVDCAQIPSMDLSPWKETLE